MAPQNTADDSVSRSSSSAMDLSKVNASPGLPFTVIDGDYENATWTRYIPEAFGLRRAIRKSPYRWCTRESTMWGIASGCVMGFCCTVLPFIALLNLRFILWWHHRHRWRMRSSPIWVIHSAFATTLLVMLPSYYYCVQDRDRYHEVIETMMNYNQWEYRDQLPERPPLPEDDPFFTVVNENETNNNPSVPVQPA